MSLKSLLASTLQYLTAFSKQRLLQAVLILREKYVELDGENQALANKIKELEAENNQLKSEQIRQKVQTVNKAVNQPTSKQPEWETKGVGNDGKGKRVGRGYKGRKGAGNKPKDLFVTHTEQSKVERCNICGRDLSDQPALESVNIRTIEDMPEMPVALRVIEVKQEKKYCRHCKEVVTASSELALPQSDIGINTTVSIVYLWVALCLPFTRISGYLKSFFGLKISTSGLSNHIISVAKIMKTVYDEILHDVIWKVERQRSRILTFVEHPGVPCHNNFAEYLIRIGVLKRKVSFGSKSARGADAYAVLLSIYSTCKLRGISFECFMKTNLKHYIRTRKPLSLREFHESTPKVKLVA